MRHHRCGNKENKSSRYFCGRSRCYIDPAFCMTVWLQIRSVYACIRVKSRTSRVKNSAIFLFVCFRTSHPPNTPFPIIIPNCHEIHSMVGSNTLTTTSYLSPQIHTSLRQLSLSKSTLHQPIQYHCITLSAKPSTGKLHQRHQFPRTNHIQFSLTKNDAAAFVHFVEQNRAIAALRGGKAPWAKVMPGSLACDVRS